MTDTNKEHWLKCKMVYEASTEEICYELPPDVEKMFHEYITRINMKPQHTISTFLLGLPVAILVGETDEVLLSTSWIRSILDVRSIRRNHG